MLARPLGCEVPESRECAPDTKHLPDAKDSKTSQYQGGIRVCIRKTCNYYSVWVPTPTQDPVWCPEIQNAGPGVGGRWGGQEEDSPASQAWHVPLLCQEAPAG